MAVKKEVITEYLDALRASGNVNMFGATIHLEEEFDLNRDEAMGALKTWMKEFTHENVKTRFPK